MKKLLLLMTALLIGFTGFAQDPNDVQEDFQNENLLTTINTTSPISKENGYIVDINTGTRVTRAYWESNPNGPDVDSRYLNISAADLSGLQLSLRTVAYNHTTNETSIINGGGHIGMIEIKNIPEDKRTNDGTLPAGLYKLTLNYEENTLSLYSVSSIDVNVNKYATFISPIDVEIPVGIKAYSLKYDIENNKLIASEIEGTIEANKSVVLVADDASENKIYSFNIKEGSEYKYTSDVCEYGSNANRTTIKNTVESLCGENDSELNPQMIGLYQPRFYYATGAKTTEDKDVDIYVIDEETSSFKLMYSAVNNGGKTKNTNNAIHQPLSSYLRLNSIAWTDDMDLSELVIEFPEEPEEDGRTVLDISIGTHNDYIDESKDQNVIRHAFSSDEITLHGIISLNHELEYGEQKDFVLHLEPKTTDAKWQTYDGENHDDAYKNLFNQLGDINAQSALFDQYTKCGNDAKVDGFFTGQIEVSAVRNTDSEDNDIDRYVYDIKLTVPCSGVYKLKFESLETTEGLFKISNESITETEIIIYPNIVNKYGEEYGFNIDGYTFALKENSNELSKGDDGRYSIVLPKKAKDENGNDYDYVIDRPLPTFFPGIYFVNSVDHKDGDVKNAKRRADAVAEAPGAENYSSSINLNALNDENTTSVPVNVNITKNGATAQYVVNVSQGNEGSNTTTAVDTIGVESGEAVYFNLQGQKVANPDKGIYVKVQNGKATKVIL